jgi:hypothetical protein
MKKILIIAAFAALTFGCSRSDEVKNTTVAVNAPPSANAPAANSEPVKVPEIFTAGEDPRGDVLFSTKKQMSAPAWSGTVTSETTPELNMLMEHAAPNRYYVKQPAGEVIVIGSDSYVNQKGKWQKVGIDLSEQLSSQMKLMTEEALAGVKDVQKVGTEQVDGKETIVYSYKTEGEEPGEATTTKIWLDKANGLPLKINVEGMINGKPQKVSTVYDYDKPVRIEAPKTN